MARKRLVSSRAAITSQAGTPVADALQSERIDRFEVEQIGDQRTGAGGDDDAIAGGDGLQAGREVGSFAEHGLFGGGADRDRIADDDHAAGDADAAGKLEIIDGSHGRHGGNDVEPGADGAFGIVLVRLRVAEIDEHAIAHEFRHEAVVAGDAAGDLVLVGVDHALQGFEVERRSETRRIDDVAEHHRQVALFGGRPRGTAGAVGRRNSAGEVCRAERVDGGAQFLAIAERQAEFPQIGIGQGWQYRRVDLLGAKEFGVFR